MKIIDAHVHLVEIIAGYGRRGELRAIGDGKARCVLLQGKSKILERDLERLSLPFFNA